MPNPQITREALAAAMHQLLTKAPLAKISVNDIVGQCGLSRNSFYYHFPDKYALVNWMFDHEFAQELEKEPQVTDWRFVYRLCNFFYEHRGYLDALCYAGQNSLIDHITDMMVRFSIEGHEDDFAKDDHYIFYVYFTVDALLASILRWLKGGAAIPPEDITRMMHKTVVGFAEKDGPA